MTKHEVEAEIEETQTVTVTEEEEFYLCDSCTKEMDSGDRFVTFYSDRERMKPLYLCETCAEKPATAIEGTEPTKRDVSDIRTLPETDRERENLIAVVTALAIGFACGAILL